MSTQTEARPVRGSMQGSTQIMHGTVIIPVRKNGTKGPACVVHALSAGGTYTGPGGLDRYIRDVKDGHPMFGLAVATAAEASSAHNWGERFDVSVGSTLRTTGCAWETGRPYILRELSHEIFIIEEVRP